MNSVVVAYIKPTNRACTHENQQYDSKRPPTESLLHFRRDPAAVVVVVVVFRVPRVSAVIGRVSSIRPRYIVYPLGWRKLSLAYVGRKRRVFFVWRTAVMLFLFLLLC